MDQHAFVQQGCALVTMSTGLRAQNLKELRQGISLVAEQCLHYHFWSRLLRPQFGEADFTNDFAAWVAGPVGDPATAERLNILNPSHVPSFEDLRRDILDILDDRLAREDFLSWARADRDFFFTDAAMIVFDTGLRALSPSELASLVQNASQGSLFFHFVDARRRTPDHSDDFSSWLVHHCGESASSPRVSALRALDPFLLRVAELRQRVGAAMDLSGEVLA